MPGREPGPFTERFEPSDVRRRWLVARPGHGHGRRRVPRQRRRGAAPAGRRARYLRPALRGVRSAPAMAWPRGRSRTDGRTWCSTWRRSSAASAPTGRTRAGFSTRTPSWASQLMEAGAAAGVEKFVQVGTVCSYPKFTPVPFREDDLWNGYPEETNAPYGLGQEDAPGPGPGLSPAIRVQCDHLIPVNLYGPGDNFDPDSSHVIPALIRKCVEAREAGATTDRRLGHGLGVARVSLRRGRGRGDRPGRRALRRRRPVNLGVGQEITIRDLVEFIVRLTGFPGEVRWDATKPDGQPRRALDTIARASGSASRPRRRFEMACARTIEWYEAARRE